MSMQKRLMARGVVLLGSFFVVLGLIFSPVFPNKMNGLDYMDNLFNMISKGSSYFIPKIKADGEKKAGTMIEAKVKVADEKVLQQMVQMLTVSGMEAVASGSELVIKGDLGKFMASSLDDADKMFANNGKPVSEKYGVPERQVMHNWYTLYKGMSKDFKANEKFAEMKVVENASKKALEPAYNYYGVESKIWNQNIGLIAFSLGFYVLYTLWFGFGIMYVFEGLGLRIGH